MKKLFLLPLLALVACSAQNAIDNAELICRDGVEYLTYTKLNTAGHASYSIVPHYKNTKGELFACGEQNEIRSNIH